MKLLARIYRWRLPWLVVAAVSLLELATFLACKVYDFRNPRDKYVAVVQITDPDAEPRFQIAPIFPESSSIRDFKRRLIEQGVKVTGWGVVTTSEIRELTVISEDGKTTAEIVKRVVADTAEVVEKKIELRRKQYLAELEAGANDPRLSSKIREGCAMQLEAERHVLRCFPIYATLGDSSWKRVNSFTAIHEKPFLWLQRTAAAAPSFH